MKRISLWLMLLMAAALASCASCSQQSAPENVSATAPAPTEPMPPAAHDPAPAPAVRPPPKLTARPPLATAPSIPPSAIYVPEIAAGAGAPSPAFPPTASVVRPPSASVARPPARSSPAAPKETAAEAINNWPFASQLSKADIAFNTPNKMVMGETADMQLIIDPSKTSEEIKKDIKAEGDKVGATVLISKVVIAKVLAPDFEVVELVNKGRQAIDFNGPTEWKWTISPKSKGSHKIHLTITAVIQIDGDKAERLIKTFDKEIVVVVTPKQVIVGFFEKYWQWLFTTLLLPLGLWLWKRYTGKKE